MGLSCQISKNSKEYWCNKGVTHALLKFFRDEGFNLCPNDDPNKRSVIISFDYVYDNRYYIAHDYKDFYKNEGESALFDEFLIFFDAIKELFANEQVEFYFC